MHGLSKLYPLLPLEESPIGMLALLPVLHCGLPVEPFVLDTPAVGPVIDSSWIPSIKPDVFICDRLSPSYLNTFRKLGIPTILLAMDFERKTELTETPLLEAADYFLIADTLTDLRYYRQRVRSVGIFWGGNMVFTDVFTKRVVPKVTEVAFGGTIGPVRNKLIDYLRSKGLNVKIIGGIQQWLPTERYVEELNGAEILLNQWGWLADSSRGPNLQIKSRVFETLACGGFLMTDMIPDTMALVPDDCVVYYRDEEDCYRKIRQYLADPSSRMRIAKTGYKWFNRMFDYKHFWRRLLEHVLARDKDVSDIYSPELLKIVEVYS